MKKEDIACPHCGKKNTWIETNTFRPFCSERCKLIDLGRWADESLRIPGEPALDNPEEDNPEKDDAGEK